jgi:transcriptional regulator with XRE-family HTH domain
VDRSSLTASTAAESLGALLRRCREAIGLTQQDLAERAGVSLGMVRDVEQRRTRRPRAGSVRALLAALNLPLSLSLLPPKPVGPPRPAPGSPAAECATTSIAVLGPLVVTRGPDEIHLGSAMRRALVARLALAAGSVVTGFMSYV